MRNLSSSIDHTNLSPDSGLKDIKKLCQEVVEFNFRGACINPIWLPEAAEILSNKNKEIVTVIDFPLGSSPTCIRVNSARWAAENGATEIDVVIQIGMYKSGKRKSVEKDISTVVDAVQPDCSVKVILETPLLNDDEIKEVAELVENSGADFVKTGTGTRGPVEPKDVKLLKEVVTIPVKAAGGIRTRKQAEELIEAGASILGSSSGIRIIGE